MTEDVTGHNADEIIESASDVGVEVEGMTYEEYHHAAAQDYAILLEEEAGRAIAGESRQSDQDSGPPRSDSSSQEGASQ